MRTNGENAVCLLANSRREGSHSPVLAGAFEAPDIHRTYSAITNGEPDSLYSPLTGHPTIQQFIEPAFAPFSLLNGQVDVGVCGAVGHWGTFV